MLLQFLIYSTCILFSKAAAEELESTQNNSIESKNILRMPQRWIIEPISMPQHATDEIQFEYDAVNFEREAGNETDFNEVNSDKSFEATTTEINDISSVEELFDTTTNTADSTDITTFQIVENNTDFKEMVKIVKTAAHIDGHLVETTNIALKDKERSKTTTNFIKSTTELSNDRETIASSTPDMEESFQETPNDRDYKENLSSVPFIANIPISFSNQLNQNKQQPHISLTELLRANSSIISSFGISTTEKSLQHSTISQPTTTMSTTISTTTTTTTARPWYAFLIPTRAIQAIQPFNPLKWNFTRTSNQSAIRGRANHHTAKHFKFGYYTDNGNGSGNGNVGSKPFIKYLNETSGMLKHYKNAYSNGTTNSGGYGLFHFLFSKKNYQHNQMQDDQQGDQQGDQQNEQQLQKQIQKLQLQIKYQQLLLRQMQQQQQLSQYGVDTSLKKIPVKRPATITIYERVNEEDTDQNIDSKIQYDDLDYDPELDPIIKPHFALLEAKSNNPSTEYNNWSLSSAVYQFLKSISAFFAI